ncbi:MAG: TusA-related sulfurtransferase [Planctomycetota bacterium]|jgi:TusA-related sulfurtransferase
MSAVNEEVIEVDARRLLCPMPVIRLQDCINKQPPDTQVRVICTDPGTMSDIPAWCRINGHQLISSEQDDYDYVFLVKKSSDGK